MSEVWVKPAQPWGQTLLFALVGFSCYGRRPSLPPWGQNLATGWVLLEWGLQGVLYRGGDTVKSSLGQELVGWIRWKFWRISKTFLGNNSVTLHQRQKCKAHCRAQGCSPTWQTNTPVVSELTVDVAVGTSYGVDDSCFALSVPDASLVVLPAVSFCSSQKE